MESKALEPTPGQIVSECFPKPEGKKVSQVQTVDTDRDDRCWKQWTGWSSQEYQCPILSVNHVSRKKKKNFYCGSLFGGGWRKQLCLLNQLVPTGRQRLEHRCLEEVVTQMSWDQFSEWEHKARPRCVLRSWDSSSMFQALTPNLQRNKQQQPTP